MKSSTMCSHSSARSRYDSLNLTALSKQGDYNWLRQRVQFDFLNTWKYCKVGTYNWGADIWFYGLAVQHLSMKLASVNPGRPEFNLENLMSNKEVKSWISTLAWTYCIKMHPSCIYLYEGWIKFITSGFVYKLTDFYFSCECGCNHVRS